MMWQVQSDHDILTTRSAEEDLKYEHKERHQEEKQQHLHLADDDSPSVASFTDFILCAVI